MPQHYVEYLTCSFCYQTPSRMFTACPLADNPILNRDMQNGYLNIHLKCSNILFTKVLTLGRRIISSIYFLSSFLPSFLSSFFPFFFFPWCFLLSYKSLLAGRWFWYSWPPLPPTTRFTYSVVLLCNAKHFLEKQMSIQLGFSCDLEQVAKSLGRGWTFQPKSAQVLNLRSFWTPLTSIIACLWYLAMNIILFVN